MDNLGSALWKVGSGILKDVLPGAGGAIVGVVNSFLGPDEQVSENMTGSDIMARIDSLETDRKNELLSSEIDLKIAESADWVKIQEALNRADATGGSKRPMVAVMMAWCVVILTLGYTAGVAYIAISSNTLPTWEELAAATGIPAMVLRSYFGMRTAEKNHRVGVAGAVANKEPVPVLGTLDKLKGIMTGR